LGVGGEHCEHQFLLAIAVVSVPFGILGGEEKILLKCFAGRMNSE
jgi:hypothetical protein